MGLLNIPKDIYGSPLVEMAFKWMKENCNAVIYDQFESTRWYHYLIEGEGIPEGEKQFYIDINEELPGILSVRIKEK